MIINVHAGHNPDGKTACGAVGIVKESTEARAIKNAVVAKLRALGHTVYDCTCEDGKSQSDVLKKIVAKCNAHKADLDVSIHLNSGRNDYVGDGSTGGTEVLIFKESSDAKKYAERVCAEISAIGFRNRGVKINPNLYVLKRTNAPAMLIECFFCDDKDDVNLYQRAGVDSIANAIVRGISGQSASASAPVQQFQPFWGVVTENNTNVRNTPSMDGAVIGKASNGQTVLVHGQDGEWYMVDSGKWIHSSLIRKTRDYVQGQTVPQPAPAPSQPVSPYPYNGVITGSGVRVRSGAGTNYPVICSTNKGQNVVVYDEKDGWCMIDNGKWISDQYVKKR